MSTPQIDYATARHAVVAMGVRLELTPPGVNGCPAVSALLSPGDAKRLAWGILADLDPLQAGEVQAVEPDPEALDAAALSAICRAFLKAKREQRRDRKARAAPRRRTGRKLGQIGPDTQAGRLFAALLIGERGAAELEATSGIPVGVIGSRLQWLRQRGLVVRTDGRGAGYPATYALTDAGRAMLEVQS